MSLHKVSAQWRYLRSQPGYQKAPLSVLARLAFWRILCSLGQSRTIEFSEHSLRLYLPPLWHGAAKLLYVFRNDYEPDLAILSKFLSPGKTMIDVGANYGVFSMIASRLVQDSGKVVAFEPAQGTFEVFKRNLSANHIANVTPMRMALSDKPGKLRLYHYADPTRNSLAPGATSADYEEVEVRTLDETLRDLGVNKVDFVKIDVEGADELVCRGALGVFREQRPPVFFESNSEAANRMGLSSNGTFKVLSEAGYQFFQTQNETLTPVSAASSVEGNVLALHPSVSCPGLKR